MKSQKRKQKLDEGRENEKMDALMVKVKMPPVSTKEVKKGFPTPPMMHEFEVQDDQKIRLCEGKELDKEKIKDQLVVQTTLTQEEVKLKDSMPYGKIKLRLICSYGGKIVIQGRKGHYIGGNT